MRRNGGHGFLSELGNAISEAAEERRREERMRNNVGEALGVLADIGDAIGQAAEREERRRQMLRIQAAERKVQEQAVLLQQERLILQADKALHENKHLEAYTTYISLNINMQKRADINAKIDMCYSFLIDQAISLITASEKSLSRETLNQAQVIIKYLKDTMQKMSVLDKYNFARAKIEWYDKKQAVAGQTIALLEQGCGTAQSQQEEFLRKLHVQYGIYTSVNTVILDENDKRILQSLENNINQLTNGINCIRIDHCINEIKQCLDKGDIETAHAKLSEARILASSLKAEFSGIHKPEYLNNDNFVNAFKAIEPALGKYRERRDQDLAIRSEAILLAALKLFKPTSKLTDLYDQHKNILVNVLTGTLGKYWFKFDQRPFPDMLQAMLIQIIRNDIADIGWGKWGEDRSKKVSIKYIDGKHRDGRPLKDNPGTIRRLRDTISGYTATQALAPHQKIELPVFTAQVARALPYVPFAVAAIPVTVPNGGLFTTAFNYFTQRGEDEVPTATVVAPPNSEHSTEDAKVRLSGW